MLAKLKIEKQIFDNREIIQENETVIIFIDEGELYYHPEWQRTYINILLKLINENSKTSNIQIILTTNSPFILSDLKKEDVLCLGESNSDMSTFGQNIHMLLKNNFFMNDTIGQFAKKKIIFLFTELSKFTFSEEDLDNVNNLKNLCSAVKLEFNVNIEENNVLDYLKNIIESIGEEIYRRKLLEMLSNILSKDKERRLLLLKREKQRIEDEITKIEEEINKNDSDK